MLTKSDLLQIQKLIAMEGKSLRGDIKGEIKLSRMRIENELGDIKVRLNNVEVLLEEMQGKINLVADYFDNIYKQLHQGLNEARKNLKLPPVPFGG